MAHVNGNLKGKRVLITGASQGIGLAIAQALADERATIMLVARNEDKLKKATRDILDRTKANVSFRAVDVDCVSQVDKAVDEMIAQFGDIDILVNCAGLALGLPTPFHEQQLEDIVRMNNTNMNGLLFTTQSVIRRAFIKKKSGTILNVTSTTALETPPFPGEVVYHANKAFQEAFSNALRVELSGTDIKVLVLRPGVVNTHFHLQRVMYDSKKYQEIMEGIRPLEPENVAASAVWMLNQPKNVAVKALDVVPNAQRSLAVFDRRDKLPENGYRQ